MCFPRTFESDESRKQYETLAACVVAALTKNQLLDPASERLKEPACILSRGARPAVTITPSIARRMIVNLGA